MAGNLSVEACGRVFANKARAASSNYGIGSDGRIGLYVDEANRSWATSSRENDNCAVTIEVANDGGATTGWHVSDAAFKSLIRLLADICARNGIRELSWQANKALIGHPEKQNMTVHRWFAAKACPGDYLYSRMGDIASAVNKRLAKHAKNALTAEGTPDGVDEDVLTTMNTESVDLEGIRLEDIMPASILPVVDDIEAMEAIPEWLLEDGTETDQSLSQEEVGQMREGSDVTRGENIISAAEASYDSMKDKALAETNGAGNVSNDSGTGGNDPKNISDSFAGLPIESLICAPIIAAAKGQQELVSVYVDGIMKLAYKHDASGKQTEDPNILKMKIHKPVRQQDKTIEAKEYTIEAPLLSLVPVPAFVMDEPSVDFNMEVKQAELSESSNHAEAQTNIGYKSWWGLDATISGSVSSDSMHKRSTDASATYHIKARAVQQQAAEGISTPMRLLLSSSGKSRSGMQKPAEGMAKLTSILAASMEPLE